MAQALPVSSISVLCITNEVLISFHLSGALPSINCLTDPNSTCETCPSTRKPEGKKNIRRNTSGILRKRIPKQSQANDVATDGVATNGSNTDRTAEEYEDIVVVIDVGKTFMAAALEWVS